MSKSVNLTTFDFNAFQAAFAAAVTQNRGDYLGKTVVLSGPSSSLKIVMGISVNAPVDGDWSVAKVFQVKGPEDQTGRLVFSHQKKDGRSMRSNVLEFDGTMYVVVGCNTHIDAVFPLQDLANPKLFLSYDKNGQPVIISGGMTLEQRYAVKRDMAQEFNLDPIWTVGEKTFADKEAEKLRVQREAERQAKIVAYRQAKEAADKARSAKLSALLQRPRVNTIAADGSKKFGIPIETVGEDEVLPSGTFCIKMQDGAPVEAYVLRKATNGRITRTDKVQVYALGDTAKVSGVDTSIVDTIVVTVDGNTDEVVIVGSFAAIEQMRIDGLNSGSIVGVKSGSKVDLYEVTKDKSKPIGHIAA